MAVQVIGYERTKNGIQFESIPMAKALEDFGKSGFNPDKCLQDLNDGLERRAQGFNYRAIVKQTGPRLSRRELRKQKRELRKQFEEDDE